jgi:RNA polymerase sigma-70 factor (ECF subfamily)
VIDEETFNALYRDTARSLRAYAARVLGNASQADDVVQETYLRVLRVSVAFNSRAELQAYVFRIATNLIADHFRAQKRERPLAEAPESAAPERDRAGRLDMARVFKLLRLRDRQLLWLGHVEGANYHELAKALGLREGSVRVLLSRARQRLAAIIEERKE